MAVLFHLERLQLGSFMKRTTIKSEITVWGILSTIRSSYPSLPTAETLDFQRRPKEASDESVSMWFAKHDLVVLHQRKRN